MPDLTQRLISLATDLSHAQGPVQGNAEIISLLREAADAQVSPKPTQEEQDWDSAFEAGYRTAIHQVLSIVKKRGDLDRLYKEIVLLGAEQPSHMVKRRWVIRTRDWHFCRRLHERYGIILEPGELRSIKDYVRDENSLWRRRSILGRMTCAVPLRKGLIFVVFDGDFLVTALSPGGRNARANGPWTGSLTEI